MANPDFIRALDYILNRCDDREIDAVAEAVVRRRRELAMFGGASKLPDPARMAKAMTEQINVEGSIDTLKQSIRDYAIRIIRQEAPELTDAQINELTRAWIPEPNAVKAKRRRGGDSDEGSGLPRNLLASMVEQFVSFSLNTMEPEEDKALRAEMGAWPDRYWKSFPQVIRLLISDYLKGEIEESDFNMRMGMALNMHGSVS